MKRTLTRVMTATVTVTLISSTAWAQAVTFSDAEIEAAIVAGRNYKPSRLTAGYEPYGAICFTNQVSAFSVRVLTPLGVVARAAMDAAHRYEPFDPASVTADMLAPLVSVSVLPTGPTKRLPGLPWTWRETWDQPPPFATKVVLRSKTHPDVILQPVTMETVPMAWNINGNRRFEGQGVRAQFEQAAVAALPSGDIDIVVVTVGTEQRCKLWKKDRVRLNLEPMTGSTQ